MNIQIFGKAKCFDTKKAERYFKERGVKFQSVDLIRYGMSRGEFESVRRAVGGVKALVDEKSKDYDKSFIAYLAGEENIADKLMEYPSVLKTPIVRNGKQGHRRLLPRRVEGVDLRALRAENNAPRARSRCFVRVRGAAARFSRPSPAANAGEPCGRPFGRPPV